MTQTLGPTGLDRRIRIRGNLPTIPQWVVPRRRLAARLELGVSGAMTLVTGPGGWGKSLGVGAWAVDRATPDGLLWLSAAGAADDPDAFWELLRMALLDTGERSVVPVPPLGAHESRRTHALALLGTWLRRTGPRVLVLDDYPTGGTGALGRDLEVVLDHARRGLSLVVISRGEPALSIQRHHVAGDLTRITVKDLAMDWHEVAVVLAHHEVDAQELSARRVERHTAGWPCGVRLTALALRDAPTIEDAIEAADRASVEYLAAEVLATVPGQVRELLVQTSMVADVDREFARVTMGSDAADLVRAGIASGASIDLHSDGSFSCHPLLRSAASAELGRAPLETRRQTMRRAAQWNAEHGRRDTGIEIGLAAEDWTWVGRALVESYTVPRLLAGSGGDLVESAVAVPEVVAAEPLLAATLLLNGGRPDAAERVLDLLDRPTSPEGTAVPDELSEAFTRLALARTRGDLGRGMPFATRARQLVAQVPLETQRELLTLVEAHVGALELSNGQLCRAESTLRHGAAAETAEPGTSGSSLDCLGQLALLSGFRGNLRQAERQAAGVLKHTPAQGHAGVAHAHLAMAWVHLHRAEHVPARQHLDRATAIGGEVSEPWYATAQLLAEARLLVSTDQPEAAVRLLAPAVWGSGRAEDQTVWTRGLVSVETASALAATGELERALEVLGLPGGPRVQGALLTARVLVDLGEEVRGRTTLAAVVADHPHTPLETQIGCWLLTARLAHDVGETERARLLVDRALREAARETMREPVSRETGWLLPLVDSDPALRRAHGGFLAGLRSSSFRHPDRRAEPASSAPVLVETLTVREAQVLGLLAEMCSTEEIANELYLSVNTVKTYVRGILRKLSVNRRVDAVRQGRELGLC